MKRTRFVAAVVALSAIVAIPFAYSAGLWFGLPVIGGSSYCSGNVGTGTSPTTGIGTAGTSTVCAVTVPAGPSSLTGTEMIPADLLSGSTAGSGGPGSGPVQSGTQTAYMPVATAASGAYTSIVPTTPSVTFTSTVPNGINTVYLNATGTTTYWGLILPSNPYDGQLLRVAAAATVTNIGLSVGSGAAALQLVQTTTRAFALYPAGYGGGAAGVVTGPFGFTLLFNLSTNTWLRVQ